jgi:predicted Rossmann fold nucleotide-binding protein DprA/Smf involved in DNA uptake
LIYSNGKFKIRIGIVGSRRRNSFSDRKIVTDIIRKAIDKYGRENVTIVSGGCEKGADAFAKSVTSIYQVNYQEHPIPRDPPVKHLGEFTERAYARNRKIAEDCDVLFALAHPDRTGGTENTISHALELGRRVFIADLEGRLYLPSDAPASDKA